MSDVALELELTRSCAEALVDREEYRVRSRMLAYENVGSLIGMSGSWLRKYVKRYAEIEPGEVTALNIRAMYERICLRIKRNTEAINQRAALIEEANDALHAARDLEQFESAPTRRESAERPKQADAAGLSQTDEN